MTVRIPRLALVAAAAVSMLALGVTAAFGALGAHDTTFGTNALNSEVSGDFNSAFGYDALTANTSAGHDGSGSAGCRRASAIRSNASGSSRPVP